MYNWGVGRTKSLLFTFDKEHFLYSYYIMVSKFLWEYFGSFFIFLQFHVKLDFTAIVNQSSIFCYIKIAYEISVLCFNLHFLEYPILQILDLFTLDITLSTLFFFTNFAFHPWHRMRLQFNQSNHNSTQFFMYMLVIPPILWLQHKSSTNQIMYLGVGLGVEL